METVKSQVQKTLGTSGKPPSKVLRARPCDGGYVVTVYDRGIYHVDHGDGGALYTSARSLLQGLTGHPKARNWTFDRYFGLGQWASPEPEPVVPIMEMMSRDTVTTMPSAPGPSVGTGIVVASGPSLGIDLRRRGHEVQKLFFAGFGPRVFASGYDPEDVLQEVYKGILARNAGTCPWDERKSSFGHYVHMVCACVVANYYRRETRRRQVETVGLPSWRTDQGGEEVADVAEEDSLLYHSGEIPDETLRDLGAYVEASPSLPDQWKGLVLRVLPLVRAGLTRAEMSAALGVSKVQVSKAMGSLRQVAAEWSSNH